MTEQKIVEEDLDFEIIREPWNKYKLEDGSILRLKNPSIKIYRTSQIDVFGLPVYRLGGITLLAVTVPKELLGTPSENEQVDATDILCEMKFSIICEDWCEYKLSDGMVLKSKTVATKIVKTKKFNKDGEPIYWASWQVLSDKVKL
jgi:hypothetical protein